MLDHHYFIALEHVGIVVPDTSLALRHWRDRLGLEVLLSQVLDDGRVRITHLELGSTELQLVELLTADQHRRGVGLDHLSFDVEDVDDAFSPTSSCPLPPAEAEPRVSAYGRRAVYLDSGDPFVRIEISSY